MKLRSLHLFLFVLVSFVVKSQTIKTIRPDSIPPLKVFLDSAMVNSPAMKICSNDVKQKEYEKEILRHKWMDQIYLTADSKYGTYGANNAFDQLSLGYGAGFTLKIPLSFFTNGDVRNKTMQCEVDGAKFRKQQVESELRKLIIAQYNKVISLRNLLVIQSSSLDVAQLNQSMAEKEFSNGQLTLEQYSRISSLYFTEKEKMETMSSEFKTEFALLMEMCGM